jgi:uncharacterized protein (DUF1697 family)
MAALVDAIAPLGLDHVATWQATGNLVLGAGGRDETTLAATLERTLVDRLGLDVPVVLRTVGDVRRVAAATPFTSVELAGTEARVQVLLVRDEPAPEALASVLALATAADRLRWSGRELWWLPTRGVSTSGLSVRAIERMLGTSTMRTQRALCGLAARHLTD